MLLMFMQIVIVLKKFLFFERVRLINPKPQMVMVYCFIWLS